MVEGVAEDLAPNTRSLDVLPTAWGRVGGGGVLRSVEAAVKSPPQGCGGLFGWEGAVDSGFGQYLVHGNPCVIQRSDAVGERAGEGVVADLGVEVCQCVLPDRGEGGFEPELEVTFPGAWCCAELDRSEGSAVSGRLQPFSIARSPRNRSTELMPTASSRLPRLQTFSHGW